MTATLERSAERDAALRAALPHVPALGWTRAAMRAGLADIGEPAEAAEWLFPRGATGMVEAFSDLADREAIEAAGALETLRTGPRIRALLAARLRWLEPWREAERRAVGLLALPWNAGIAARVAGRTADTLWRAAGDTSTDLSRHTRRLTLAGIHVATLAFWLRQPEPPMEEVLAFLDRRLADLARLQRRPAPRS
ncbi:COQ9 family protein [Pseudoroseomonas wenyumeiae]|uniref:COQ9 family protein n=1 Tax=Teichococcus wenyumeiae TaxID=2478470 RepID=A0A3A9JBW8_9PROT|nr:COQ9 family protein [Pseudoroseomonas wenyumeiae]RKK02971.1 COQ9 family protein [Pseudoroseomonas wenyumeiae]RMI26504.1 COQ9 family protein [Pseudoroseomonas wenyumeiae]